MGKLGVGTCKIGEQGLAIKNNLTFRLQELLIIYLYVWLLMQAIFDVLHIIADFMCKTAPQSDSEQLLISEIWSSGC